MSGQFYSGYFSREREGERESAVPSGGLTGPHKPFGCGGKQKNSCAYQ